MLTKITEKEYIGSFDEISELVNKGYTLLGDLKLAIEGEIIKKRHQKIRLYIDHESKLIDIFSACFCKEVFEFGRIRLKYYLSENIRNVILD